MGLVAAGMLAMPAVHAALGVGSSGQVTVNYVGNLPYSTITASGGLAALGTFGSFCLEQNEHYSPGGTYNAILNTKAVEGGAGPAGDPISMGTAWLYSGYRAGTLISSGSNLDLQNAIWWLEGEISTSQAANPYIVQLNSAHAGWGVYNAGNDANGAYGVLAINVTIPGGGRGQDHLALVPEPSTWFAGIGALAMLLGGFRLHSRGSSVVRIG